MTHLRTARQSAGLPPQLAKPQRTCRAPGCDETLPADAHRNVRYCAEHIRALGWGRRYRVVPS